MPRTLLTKSVATGSNTAAGIPLTMAAADVGNLNAFQAAGTDLIVAQNTGGSTYTVTVTSAPDPWGRTRDIAAENIAAGELRVFGPFAQSGWMQTDGRVYLQASNAAVKFGIVQLPG